MQSRIRAAAHAAVACAALGAASGAFADVDVELNNADKVKASIDPPEEVEVYRFTAPAGSKVVAAARGLRNGPVAATFLSGPGGDAEGTVRGKGSKLSVTLADSGEHEVEVTSFDFERTGDYSFALKWKAPRLTRDSLAFGAGGTRTFRFSADGGAKVRVVAAANRKTGSLALPTILSVTGPDGPVDVALDALGGTRDVTPRFVAPATGDYFVEVLDGGAGGDVDVTASIVPPKLKPRKIDVTTRKTGAPGGAEAFARILEPAGGTITVPEDFGPIAGTSITIPPGSLPVGTAIVIATAPALPLPGGDAQVGEPVYFGPEGLRFTISTTGEPVLISIPVNLEAVGNDTEAVVVYTRDASGRVTQVPPPYDFVTEPGFVTFPVSHFSSFVAAADGSIVASGSLFTIVAGLDAVADVCLATASDDQTRLLFLADGTAVLKQVLVAGTGFEVEAYAGGGSTTGDGTPRLEFDFGGAVQAVTNDSETVFVATATQIFSIDAASGAVTRILGDGVSGDSGDDAAAVDARMTDCSDLLEDSSGNLWFTDRAAGRVRQIVGGIVDTVAGTGVSGSNGDQTTALATRLDAPSGIAERLGTADMFVAERGRVRILSPDTGTIATLAGDPGGDTGCTTATGLGARFTDVTSVAFDFLEETVLLTSSGCHAIYEVAVTTGAVRVAAGTPGTPGYRSDGLTPAEFPVTSPRAAIALPGLLVYSERGPGGGDARVRYFAREIAAKSRR